ncbi:MAG: hypothetical protein FWD39_05555 [Clostridiales bacterium]|nr:hypothetical protein [Clostridiales bacterium]
MSELKKGLLSVLLIGCIFSLAACDFQYGLYHSRTKKEVISIELINYNSPDAKSNPKEEYPFDLEKLEVLETLSSDSFEGFLAELSEIGGLAAKHKQVLNSPVGVGIKITYHDGSFAIITVTVVNEKEYVFRGEYDADSSIKWYFGIPWQDMIDDFKTLVNKYFDTQIE